MALRDHTLPLILILLKAWALFPERERPFALSHRAARMSALAPWSQRTWERNRSLAQCLERRLGGRMRQAGCPGLARTGGAPLSSPGAKQDPLGVPCRLGHWGRPSFWSPVPPSHLPSPHQGRFCKNQDRIVSLTFQPFSGFDPGIKFKLLPWLTEHKATECCDPEASAALCPVLMGWEAGKEGRVTLFPGGQFGPSLGKGSTY